jgi:hypothetical protein
MTKSNGRGSKSAQSSLPSTWAKPKKQAFSFLHLSLLQYVFLGHWRFTILGLGLCTVHFFLGLLLLDSFSFWATAFLQSISYLSLNHFQ